MPVARIVIGALLLLFGRKLFWLYVAASGFALGLTLATRLLSDRPEWFALLIGVGAGILGALLAVVFQHVAIGVGGFLAGAFIAVSIGGRLRLDDPAIFWLVLVVGGVIGAVLTAALFDWALIALSSAAGAALIVGGLGLAGTAAVVAWLVLLVAGAAVQAGMLRYQRG